MSDPNTQAASEGSGLSGIADALGVQLDATGQPLPAAQEPAPAAAQSQPAAAIDPLDAPLPNTDAVPEKFRGQPLRKVLESQAEAERVFHTNAGKVKDLSYELQLQRTATESLKEQMESLRKAVEPPKPQPNPFDGLNLQEDVILRPEAVVERIQANSRKEAEAIAAAQMEKLRSEITEKQRLDLEFATTVRAAEMAKSQLQKSDEEWQGILADIGPAVLAKRAEGAHLKPETYVHEYKARQARYSVPAPVVQVQQQGSAPVVASRGAGAPISAPSNPSARLSPSQLEKAEHMANLLGLDPKAYLAKVAAQLGS